MTNKIASEVLKASSIQQMGFCKVIVDGKAFSVKEALDIAIEALEQQPCEDAVSRKDVHDMLENLPVTVENKWFNWLQKACIRLAELPSVTPKETLRKGEWLRMSDLSEKEDDRYKCSHCGNVVHYKNKMNLYTFNRWCGRCGSDNVRKSENADGNS